jgi:hypothetical protein
MLMLTPLVAACDPGVAYLPQDWKKVNEVLFTQPISSDLALSTNGILILVGDRRAVSVKWWKSSDASSSGVMM